jgi:hypothetical protein
MRFELVHADPEGEEENRPRENPEKLLSGLP